MNAQLIFQGVAGYAGEAIGVKFDGKLTIEELRLSYPAHLQFMSGRTLASLLKGSVLVLEDGRKLAPAGTPQLKIPCRVFEIPYRLTDVLYLDVKEVS